MNLLIVVAPHGYYRLHELPDALSEVLPKDYQMVIVPYRADEEHRDFRFFVIPSADKIQVPCEVLPAGLADDMTAFLKEKGLLR